MTHVKSMNGGEFMLRTWLARPDLTRPPKPLGDDTLKDSLARANLTYLDPVFCVYVQWLNLGCCLALSVPRLKQTPTEEEEEGEGGGRERGKNGTWHKDIHTHTNTRTHWTNFMHIYFKHGRVYRWSKGWVWVSKCVSEREWDLRKLNFSFVSHVLNDVMFLVSWWMIFGESLLGY